MTEVERLKMQCHEWRVQAELRKQQVRFLQGELDGALFRAATFLELEDSDEGVETHTAAIRMVKEREKTERIKRLEKFLGGATDDLAMVCRNLHQSGASYIPHTISRLEETVKYGRDVLEDK